jgi:hypothetical protein
MAPDENPDLSQGSKTNFLQDACSCLNCGSPRTIMCLKSPSLLGKGKRYSRKMQPRVVVRALHRKARSSQEGSGGAPGPTQPVVSLGRFRTFTARCGAGASASGVPLIPHGMLCCLAPTRSAGSSSRTRNTPPVVSTLLPIHHRATKALARVTSAK